jgi:hypothetical protein
VSAVVLAVALALAPRATAAEPGLGTVLVDPTNAISQEWVVAAGQGRGCRLAVDPSGRPWLGCRERFIAAPNYAALFAAERPFNQLVWTDNGELLAASEDRLGVYGIAEAAKTWTSVSRVKFHTLRRSEGMTVRVFPGADKNAYAVFEGAGASEVLLLTRRGDDWSARTLIKAKGSVSAVAGDGTRTFVAMGRKILGFATLPDGSLDPQPLWMHPQDDIVSLVWGPRAGLIYTTKSAVGFLGSRYRFEFMRARSPQVVLGARALYVMPEDGGVLKLEGIEGLERADGELAATGAPIMYGPDPEAAAAR